MGKRFNDTGLCIPHRHYMVDTSAKLKEIVALIEHGDYFTINRPRQFGKTTTLALLFSYLKQISDYQVFTLSFEGMGDAPFTSEQAFVPAFLRIIARSVMFTEPELAHYFETASKDVHDFEELSKFIARYVLQLNKKVVVFIDEVDKSSDNQIFLHFLGVLRNKYLQRDSGQDYTFQSVVLAGVHDVKTLKAKLRPDAEQKYNSPWNIAVDFTVDLSFSAVEIESMLRDYSLERGIEPDIPALAERLYYYTSGYPYLVSKICKFIDEKVITERADKTWTLVDVEAGFKLITHDAYTTTLFDSLIKNLENNPELYDNVFSMVVNGKKLPFNISVPIINLGYLYGIFRNADGACQIHNRVFEQRLYNYFLAKLLTTESEPLLSLQPGFYTADGLNLPLILERFQAFMRENYAERDAKFLEREGRLLFLSYLKPIINGKGYDFKEPNVGDERRMDIVITYRDKRYVLELKIWYGAQAHAEGLQQLSDYLDLYGLSEGYLLIYDFNKGKSYKQEQIVFKDKQILAVWV